MNDRQTGPAEEGEARLASPSSQICGHAYWNTGCAQCMFHLGKSSSARASVQQSIPDEVRRLLQNIAKGYRWSAKARRDMAGVQELGKAYVAFNAQLADGFEAEADILDAFLAGSPVSGQGEG